MTLIGVRTDVAGNSIATPANNYFVYEQYTNYEPKYVSKIEDNFLCTQFAPLLDRIFIHRKLNTHKQLTLNRWRL